MGLAAGAEQMGVVNEGNPPGALAHEGAGRA